MHRLSGFTGLAETPPGAVCTAMAEYAAVRCNAGINFTCRDGMHDSHSRDDAIDWEALKVDELADLVTRSLCDAPPALTHFQLQEIEKCSQADASTQRAALASLLQSGSELIDAASSSRETALAFAELQEGIQDYLDNQKALRELLRAARMRLLLALAQRDDMHELLGEMRLKRS